MIHYIHFQTFAKIPKRGQNSSRGTKSLKARALVHSVHSHDCRARYHTKNMQNRERVT